jgi:hypothetical protein
MKKMVFLISLIFSFSAFSSNLGTGTLNFNGMEVEREKYDIVFVVDNSGSMHTHKDVIYNKVLSTFHKLDHVADWKAAFMTADFADARNGNYYGFDGSISSLSSNRQKLVNEALINLWSLHGDANEKLYDSVLHALAAEKSFMRKDAKFILVYVTDEDDDSILSSEDFYHSFLQTYQRNPHFRLVAHTKGGVCNYSNNINYPEKLEELIKLTKGRHLNICSNFASNLVKSIAPSVKLDLKMALPVNHRMKLFLNDMQWSDYTLTQDRRTLFIHRPERMDTVTFIRIEFNLWK